MGTACRHFIHQLINNAVLGKKFRCTPGGNNFKSNVVKLPGHIKNGCFIIFLHTDKHRAFDRQVLAGGDLGLGIGTPKIHVHSHDLTG